MKTVSGKRFCKILEAGGWRLRRISGSHHAKALDEAGRQQYDLTELISGVRQRVDRWRELSDPGAWRVTPRLVSRVRYDD